MINKIHFFLFIFFFFNVCLESFGCGPAEFVIDQFAAKCKSISEGLKEVELGRKMDLPDIASRTSRLLNLWVDFFLDHGDTPPPVFKSVDGNKWKISTRFIGHELQSFLRNEKPSEEIESVLVTLDIISDPKKLVEIHAILATWSLAIDVKPDLGSSADGEWIKNTLVEPLCALGSKLGKFQGLCFRMESFIKSELEEWHQMISARASETAEIIDSRLKLIQTCIKKEFSDLRKILIW